MHIEPGHTVRFHANDRDGTPTATSCWFTHPQGRAPDGGPTCTWSPGADTFQPVFSTPGGNSWWVEVYVDADRPLAGVDARDDGGPWVALEKRSWGAWAKSFHVQDGSIVEFRARAQDGSVAHSGGYRWPGGQPA